MYNQLDANIRPTTCQPLAWQAPSVSTSQYPVDGTNAPAGSFYRPMLITDIVPKLGIQREGPGMQAGLNQSHTSEVPLSRAFMHRVHQTPANRTILHGRINRNRPNTCDRVAFVQKIAANNPPIDLRHHRIKLRIG